MLAIVRAAVRPPKEGRYNPNRASLEDRRRCQNISKKQLIMILICLATFLWVWYVQFEADSHQSGNRLSGIQDDLKSLLEHVPTTNLGGKHNRVDGLAEKAATGVDRIHINKDSSESDNPRVAGRLPAAEAENPIKQHPKDISGVNKKDQDVIPVSKPEGSPGIKFVRNLDLENALERVIFLLPGEMAIRDLIRPLEGTGKEKLRELGLRTRSFRQFFEAWEELHLVTDSNGITFARDDIVQYLTRLGQQSPMNMLQGAMSSMTTGQAIRAYENYKSFLAKFGQLLFPYTTPFSPDHMSLHLQFKNSDRGIVLTAGDDQAHYLLTTIYSFRALGCRLPIEVMYLGDSDLSEEYRAELEELGGVVTRDISQMIDDEGWKLAGWAIKPFAILLSSFREVIFIDADSLFFKSPEMLFEDPDYKKSGALFFKDRMMMPDSKKRWVQQVLPKPFSSKVKQNRFWTGESAHMQESGVVVVDKWKHFLAMLLVTRMNGPDRDGSEEKGLVGVYDMVYGNNTAHIITFRVNISVGDKETFWLGWELSGDFKYNFHRGDAGAMGVIHNNTISAVNSISGSPENDQPGEQETEAPSRQLTTSETSENYTICAPQLLHLDLEGKPLWFNGWILDNKFADKSHKQFGTFEAYLVEPHVWEHEEPWELKQDNLCCLTTNSKGKFGLSDEDQQTLSMIINRAKEVDAAIVS